MVDVAAAQARFYMAHGYLAIIGGNRPRHHGGGIALDDDPVWLFEIEHLADFHQRPRRESIERLSGGHQVEIVVGNDARDIEHLIEHLAVLR